VGISQWAVTYCWSVEWQAKMNIIRMTSQHLLETEALKDLQKLCIEDSARSGEKLDRSS
jgi:hypothetical protein